MGLKLETTLATGVVAEYYSIRDIKIDNDEMTIRQDLHISKALKDEGKSAIRSELHVFPHVKAGTAEGHIYEIAYGKLKGTEEFSEAIDV